ncbi:MAG TPA: DUF4129 domain-containing protein [Chitinophagaceae bacterium]|nr:DUF4129 domain-containing protein [Chitinophagaceae bacterium]
MRSKFFLYCFFTLLIFLPSLVHSQEPVTDSVLAITDSTYSEDSLDSSQKALTEDNLVYVIRNVPADSLMAIKKEKSYAYMVTLDSLLREQNKELQSILERQKKLSDSPFSSNIFSSKFLGIILWVSAIAALVFLIYRMFLSNSALFKINRKNMDVFLEEKEKDDAEDMTARKIRAVQSGNYRMAVRFAYLELLQFLTDKRIIEVRSDKTNYQYVSELKSYSWVDAFAALTLTYEYVWYGKYEIGSEKYNRIDEEFNLLKQKIK